MLLRLSLKLEAEATALEAVRRIYLHADPTYDPHAELDDTRAVIAALRAARRRWR